MERTSHRAQTRNLYILLLNFSLVRCQFWPQSFVSHHLMYTGHVCATLFDGLGPAPRGTVWCDGSSPCKVTHTHKHFPCVQLALLFRSTQRSVVNSSSPNTDR